MLKSYRCTFLFLVYVTYDFTTCVVRKEEMYFMEFFTCNRELPAGVTRITPNQNLAVDIFYHSDFMKYLTTEYSFHYDYSK